MQDRGNAIEADFRGEWRGHQIPHRFEHRQYKRPGCTRRQDHGRLLFRHVCNVPSNNKSQHSGGDPSASAQTARVILADPNTEIFQHLVKSYQGVPGKYVESYLWVKKCVEKGTVVYTPLVYKNPGGRRPGEEYARYPVSLVRRRVLTSSSGGHNSRKKTRSTSAIGSLPRSLTRRRAVGLATDSTSNFVTWYVTLLGFLIFRQSETNLGK